MSDARATATSYDAVVVGSGPNGLAAAIVLARAGRSVLVLEEKETIGGGARTQEVTIPGFHHDICSAIHPMALVSPFFRDLPLADYGLSWAYSPAAIAHPLDDGSAATLELDLDATAARLGDDAAAYRSLLRPFAKRAGAMFDSILRPISPFTRHPLLLAHFGLLGLQPATRLANRFRTNHARALLAGCSAHSFLPLDRVGSASFGLVLMLAGHAIGWPAAKGGSIAIINALAAYLRSLGGTIRTGHPVRSLRDVPDSRAVIFDVTPRQLAAIAGDALPARYVRRLQHFRYGPGVFKIDFALDGPIPWKAAECSRSATVHVGGTLEEIAAHERSVFHGRMTDKPFVLVAQQSMFDDTRAPRGQHTGWAYCHVPQGSTDDASEAIVGQIERFAPGFRDRILARRTINTAQYEAYNANFVGGDIAGGANVMLQFLTRPFPRVDPYATPNRRLYIASSSTPPGGGVHGMCGYWAARSALRHAFGRH
ncbi:MAG: NAD(P)/FAD-dependent oxidoreductase [Acidobacteria bacterium]|nr:NAD(P)/FAD-dependent oxidoreductase [Acidobacteriota bacterium]MBV9476757.1 NAD(P)/FAD-dependent oxidoreductase [Acidobacteriota bacterium]